MQRRIDPSSERPRFRQLADILRAKIDVGEWEPGRNLPSEAALGSEYQISQGTVRRGLAILRAEGLIEAEPGLPWMVRERGEPIVYELQRGDKVRARLATRDDQEQHEIPEGTLVLVISHKGRRDRVFRADEVDAEVPTDGD